MSDAADLPDDVLTLKAIISEKSALLRAHELRIAVLEERLRLAAHKRFGASSEKADADQLGLFNEAEAGAVAESAAEASENATVTIPEHTRAKGGRKPLADDLARVRVEHDIAAADKLCPCGSGHMRPRIGEVVTEQADIVPAQVQVLQHVRFKYGPCRVCDGVFPEAAAGVEENPGEPRPVIVAPLPAQPIPKSIASPNTCAFVVTAKYADGLPLYRQEKILARYGLDCLAARSPNG
jgi:transposase